MDSGAGVVLGHPGRNRLNQLLQTPWGDDGDGLLIDAGVVKLTRREIAGTPVGGDGGDEDDFVGEAAAEFGLEEGVAFTLDAEPDGIAEMPEDDLERIGFAVGELVEAMEESGFAFGHGAAVGGAGFIASGAGGGFVGLELIEFGLGLLDRWLARAIAQRLVPALELPGGFFGEIDALMLPRAERGTGDDGAGIDKNRPSGGKGGEGRKSGITEFAAVSIRHGGVANEAFARAEFAAGTLEEEAGSAGVAFDEFTHRADVVGADECVFPCEGGGMAGVVHDAGEHLARIIGHAGDDEGVVGRYTGIVTADELLPVPKIAMRGQRALSTAIHDACGLQRGDGVADQSARFLSERLQIRRNEITAGQIGPIEAHQARAMRV